MRRPCPVCGSPAEARPHVAATGSSATEFRFTCPRCGTHDCTGLEADVTLEQLTPEERVRLSAILRSSDVQGMPARLRKRSSLDFLARGWASAPGDEARIRWQDLEGETVEPAPDAAQWLAIIRVEVDHPIRLVFTTAGQDRWWVSVADKVPAQVAPGPWATRPTDLRGKVKMALRLNGKPVAD